MSDQKNVQVVFSIKNDQFNKSLADQKKQIQLTKSELNAADKELKTYGKTTENLGNKQQLLNTQISNVTQKMKSYQESVTKNTDKLKENKKQLEELGNKKKDLNKQYKEAVKMYGEESAEAQQLKDKLNQVTDQYKDKENAIKNNVKAINNHAIEVNRSKGELADLQGQLNKVNQDLSESSNKFLQMSEKCEQAAVKLDKLSGGLNAAGNTLMKLGAPALAFSGYALKAAADFESGMSNVQAISGATGKDLELLTEKAKEMGAKTSFSAKSASDGLAYMSLAGWDTQTMLESLEPVLRLAEAGNLDLGRASDLTTDSLSALGLSSQDLTRYLDICAQAQRKSNTTADAMMEAYIACGGTMKNLNVPLEESATYLGILANRGKKGAESGNALNSVMINLTSGAGQADVAMKKLGISAFDSNGKFKGMNVVFTELNQKLSKCSEEQRNTYLAMIGGKTQIDTLNSLLSGTTEEFSDLNNNIKNSKGALNEMAQAMQNNTRGNITKLKSQLEGLGIQVGEKLLPHVNDLIGHLSKLIEWFGNLDTETQQTIVKMGLMSFAMGGVLKTAGSLVGGVSSVVKGVGGMAKAFGLASTTTTALSGATTALAGTTATGGLAGLSGGFAGLSAVALPVAGIIAGIGATLYVAKEANDVFNSSIMKTTDEMSLVEKAIASVGGVTRYSKEQLEAMGFSFREWNEGVSKDTQQQLESTAEKIRNLNWEIDKVNMDNLISKDDVENIKQKTNELCDEIIKTIKSRQDESNKELKAMFDEDGVDEQEQKILDSIHEGTNNQVKEVKDRREQIYKITEQAYKENRALTEEENVEIERLTREAGDIQLNNVAKTQEELQLARADYHARMKDLDYNGLQEQVQQGITSRNEEVAKLEEHYNSNIERLKLHREEAKEEDKKYFDAEIAELENQKNNSINLENQKYTELLKLAHEKYPELLAQINLYNGQELTYKDEHSQKVLNQIKAQYEGLDKITKDGLYKIYDKNTNTYKNIRVDIDENSGKIVGIYDYWTGMCGAYTKQQAKDLKQLAQDSGTEGAKMISTFEEVSEVTVNSNNQIVNSNGSVVSSLEDVEEQVDGTRTGIIKINDTPIKVVVDKDGTIRNIQDIKTELDTIQDKSITIKAKKLIYGDNFDLLYGKGHIRSVKTEFDKIQDKSITTKTKKADYGDNLDIARTKGYADGTTYSAQGVFNVNERGWELFDNTQAIARSLNNEAAFLSKGTKVTNHLASTMQMQRDIKLEVNNQLNRAIYNTLEDISKLLKKQDNKLVNNNTFNNTYNVDASDKFKARNFQDDVVKQWERQLMRRGIKLNPK